MKKLDPPGDKPRKNYLTLPQDYTPELDDDQSFEAVVKVKKDGDRWCIIELDGIEIEDDYDEEVETEDELNFGQLASKIVGGKKGVV